MINVTLTHVETSHLKQALQNWEVEDDQWPMKCHLLSRLNYMVEEAKTKGHRQAAEVQEFIPRSLKNQ